MISWTALALPSGASWKCSLRKNPSPGHWLKSTTDFDLPAFTSANLFLDHSIIASCIPCLKQLFEKILRRVGILTTPNTISRTGYPTHTYDNTNFKTSIKANSRVDDSGSQDLIIEQTPGIQLETTVSVHSFSKGSAENDAS